MLAIERRNEILEKLQNDRRVVVSELSQIYEVSEETIRRDLDKLVQDGFAIKSYGGAVINENVNIELPFNIRKNRNIVGKQHIAELVSEQIKDGDSIMLDAHKLCRDYHRAFWGAGLEGSLYRRRVKRRILCTGRLSDRSDASILSCR